MFIHLFTTFCVFWSVVVTNCKLLPDLYWNSSNSLFQDEYPGMLDVQIRDRLNIRCPQYKDTELVKDTEQSVIFRVSEESYTNCVLGPEARALGSCQNPFQPALITIVFREFTPNPIGLEFTPGHNYYFISTSDGSSTGLQNIAGGLCQDKNMRLKISILPDLRHQITVPNVEVAPPSTTNTPVPKKDITELMEKVMQEKANDPYDWWSPESAPSDPLPAYRSRLLTKHNKDYGTYELVETNKLPQDIANSRFWPLAADQARQVEKDVLTPQKTLYVIEEVVDVSRLRSSSTALSMTSCSLLFICNLLVGRLR